MTEVIKFPSAAGSLAEQNECRAEAFCDFDSRISDCMFMAEIALQTVERAIEGRDDKHEKAMFAVYQTAAMLKKLRTDYRTAWRVEQSEVRS